MQGRIGLAAFALAVACPLAAAFAPSVQLRESRCHAPSIGTRLAPRFLVAPTLAGGMLRSMRQGRRNVILAQAADAGAEMTADQVIEKLLETPSYELPNVVAQVSLSHHATLRTRPRPPSLITLAKSPQNHENHSPDIHQIGTTHIHSGRFAHVAAKTRTQGRTRPQSAPSHAHSLPPPWHEHTHTHTHRTSRLCRAHPSSCASPA